MTPSFLQLLGPPRLLSPDGSVFLNGGIPVAVLAYLMLEDRPISRDHMGELFWPGLERSRRRHNLRQTLLRIRSSASQDLIKGDGTLRLDREGLRSDILEIQDHLAHGRVRAVLDLWQGPFLSGFRRPGSWELEDWVEGKRSFLEGAVAKAAREEAMELLSSDRPDDALPLLTKARRILPLDPELRALEVVALATLGRTPEAEGLFQTLEREDDSEATELAREALALAGDRSAPRSDPEPDQEADSEEGPLPGPRPWFLRPGWRSALLWAGVMACLFLSWQGRGARQRAAMEEEWDGYGFLACAGWATDGRFDQLYRMNLDGTGKHRISEAPLCESAWIPEAGALVGPVPPHADTARLMRFSPNPENPRSPWIARPIEASAELHRVEVSRANPKVGGSGVLVFWAQDGSGNADVYALETETGAIHRLTTDPAEDRWPTVAPGSDLVVFTSYRTGGGDLYSIRLDGTGLQRLTTHPARDNLAWIRGDSVLFVRGRGVEEETGNMELVLLDLSEGTETYLTDNSWNDYEAAWSPDGRRICWQSERLGHYESDIVVMDLRTGQQRNLTNAPGRESDCRWTPDGAGVIYIKYQEDGVSDLFIQDLQGGEPVNLSRYPGLESPMDIFRLPDFLRQAPSGPSFGSERRARSSAPGNR